MQICKVNFKFVTRIKSCVRGFIESTCNKNRFETFDNVNFTNIFQENSIRDVYTRARQLLEISKRVLINFSLIHDESGGWHKCGRCQDSFETRQLYTRNANSYKHPFHPPFFPHIFFAAFSFVHSTYLRKYTHTHTHTRARDIGVYKYIRDTRTEEAREEEKREERREQSPGFLAHSPCHWFD